MGEDVYQGALVGECHRLIDKTLAQLEQIHSQIKNIQKSIEGIIAFR
jgi:toxin YxiD